MEKIAVHCKTEEEWTAVLGRLGLKHGGYPVDGESCVCTDLTGYADVQFQAREGYKVISAAEYLEGEVEELKQGSVVKCVDKNDYGNIEEGETYTVSFINTDDGNLKFEGITQCFSYPQHLFKPTNKPKSKENKTMLEINSTIRTVLVEEDTADFTLVEKVQQQFGGEIAQNFTGLINFRRDKQLYIDEIKRLEDEAKKAAKEAAKKDK